MAGGRRDYDGELLRGNTDILLLFLIERLGRTYGYQLIKEVERRSGGFFRFKEGTVYPALHKLESEGLVRAQWDTLSGGQDRRYYVITEKGEAALERRLAMWQSFAAAMSLVFAPGEGAR